MNRRPPKSTARALRPPVRQTETRGAETAPRGAIDRAHDEHVPSTLGSVVVTVLPLIDVSSMTAVPMMAMPPPMPTPVDAYYLSAFTVADDCPRVLQGTASP